MLTRLQAEIAPWFQKYIFEAWIGINMLNGNVYVIPLVFMYLGPVTMRPDSFI